MKIERGREKENAQIKFKWKSTIITKPKQQNNLDLYKFVNVSYVHVWSDISHIFDK